MQEVASSNLAGPTNLINNLSGSRSVRLALCPHGCPHGSWLRDRGAPLRPSASGSSLVLCKLRRDTLQVRVRPCMPERHKLAVEVFSKVMSAAPDESWVVARI